VQRVSLVKGLSAGTTQSRMPTGRKVPMGQSLGDWPSLPQESTATMAPMKPSPTSARTIANQDSTDAAAVGRPPLGKIASLACVSEGLRHSLRRGSTS